VALSGVLQGAGGLGAVQRNEPNGGVAYGMPLNDVTLPSTTPYTGPLLVCTGIGSALTRPAIKATTASTWTTRRATEVRMAGGGESE